MVTENHYRWDFIGLSTDDKPTPATSEKVVDGSTFYCSDTSKLYVYCNDQWYEKESTGGTTYEDFVGTDGETAGTAGLVPAPATTDAGKYLKADGTWAEVAAGGGGATPLTSADYNYHTSGTEDDTVALWKMPAGIYESYSTGVKTGIWSPQSYSANAIFVVRHPSANVSTITMFEGGVIDPDIPGLTAYMGGVVDVAVRTATGERITGLRTYGNGNRLLNTVEVQDNLTSTRTDAPLSANQGKVLKGLIDDLTARVAALE